MALGTGGAPGKCHSFIKSECSPPRAPYPSPPRASEGLCADLAPAAEAFSLPAAFLSGGFFHFFRRLFFLANEAKQSPSCSPFAVSSSKRSASFTARGNLACQGSVCRAPGLPQKAPSKLNGGAPSRQASFDRGCSSSPAAEALQQVPGKYCRTKHS